MVLSSQSRPPGASAHTRNAGAVDISDASLVTTEEVLSEFLAAVSAHGDRARRLACRLVREILNDAGIEVVAQSHESFFAGLALYERRPDKQYSLVDCISMNAMRQQGFMSSSRTTGTSNRKDSFGSWTGVPDRTQPQPLRAMRAGDRHIPRGVGGDPAVAHSLVKALPPQTTAPTCAIPRAASPGAEAAKRWVSHPGPRRS